MCQELDLSDTFMLRLPIYVCTSMKYNTKQTTSKQVSRFSIFSEGQTIPYALLYLALPLLAEDLVETWLVSFLEALDTLDTYAESFGHHTSAEATKKTVLLNQLFVVLIQHHETKKWDRQAKIIEIRQDGRSYLLETANGNHLL